MENRTNLPLQILKMPSHPFCLFSVFPKDGRFCPEGVKNIDNKSY